VIASHAEPLITAMKFFIANVATLCEKTMEDTLWSIGLLNAARVDYDGKAAGKIARLLPFSSPNFHL
jgi:hypothetical protein